MAKRIVQNLTILLLIATLAIPAISQDCGYILYSDLIISVDRDGASTFNFPVDIYNNCKIGGLRIDIITDPPGVIAAIDIDTTGGRISNWELLTDTTSTLNPSRLRVLGIANWIGGPDTPPMDTGNGLLFNAVFKFGCSYDDTNTTVNVIFDSVLISDSTGYILYDGSIVPGHVNVGDEVTNLPRGDANCSGTLLGSDVTYLVGYFRGAQNCPCALCCGDANGSGQIIGSDVTYLVRYFSGVGPPPPPCDE